MLDNISLSIITSEVVNNSIDLVLPDTAIVTVTDNKHVKDRKYHEHEHAESPQSRSWMHGIQVLHGTIEVCVTTGAPRRAAKRWRAKNL